MAPSAVPQTADALRDWLRALKADSGASFADIARAIGEEERTVKRWMPETGKAVVPSGDSLLRLLDFFGVTITPAPPRAVALSIAGELRELRNMVAHSSTLRYQPSLDHLTEDDRRFLQRWGSVDVNSDHGFDDVATEFGITIEEGHDRYGDVVLKVHGHPANQAAMEEHWQALEQLLRQGGSALDGAERSPLSILEEIGATVAEMAQTQALIADSLGVPRAAAEQPAATAEPSKAPRRRKGVGQ